jgi:hypothetical protein
LRLRGKAGIGVVGVGVFKEVLDVDNLDDSVEGKDPSVFARNLLDSLDVVTGVSGI